MLVEEQRESGSGYHYYTTYLDCPYKWFLKYFLGLRPLTLKKALFFGGALHDGLRDFWSNDRNLEKGLEGFTSTFDSKKSLLSADESYEIPEMEEKGRVFISLFKDFVEREYPRDKYEVLEFEKVHILPLYSSDGIKIEHSIRPDLVLRRIEDNVGIVLDYKTTSFSKDSAFKAFASGDQATGYLWGMREVYKDIQLWIAKPIIFYSRGSVREISDFGDIVRSSYDLKRYQMNMTGLIMEISSKVYSLKLYPSELLFPRHGSFCGMFGCEYENICRLQNGGGDDIPFGFEKDSWVERDENLKLIKSVYKELGLGGENV